jgi:hypothetical protein
VAAVVSARSVRAQCARAAGGEFPGEEVHEAVRVGVGVHGDDVVEACFFIAFSIAR